MKLLVSMSLALAVLPLPRSLKRRKSRPSPGIFNGTGYGAAIWLGGAVQPSNQPLGAVVNGGNGAFDMFGYYNSGVGSRLTRARSTCSAATPSASSTLSPTTPTARSRPRSTSSGNLGSDGWELVSHNQGGLIGEVLDGGAGSCADQPVLALVSGNNGLGKASITPDRYNVSFDVTLAAGQSLSLLNFASLSSDENGPTDEDVLLAKSVGQSLLSTPRLDGLTGDQIRSIANYNFTSAVPEPATWIMMMVGFGVLGAGLRRRNRAYQAA